MKIVRETIVTGFGSPVVKYTEPKSDEAFAAEMQKRLGVLLWNSVPIEIRKNGRAAVGHLDREFVCADMDNSDDLAAIRVCLAAAEKQHTIRHEEFEL